MKWSPLSRLLILICFLQAAFEGVAQNAITDSLEKALKLATDDSSKLDLLVQLSKNYEHVDTAKSWRYYHAATELAKRSDNEVFEGYAFELAGVLYTRSDQKLALEYYNKALDILQRQPQILRIKRSVSSINNNLGVIHYLNGDFEGALNYFLVPIKFYEENDKLNPNLGLGYGNVSSTYADLGKLQNAVVYSSKSFAFAKKLDNKNLLMSAGIAHGNNLLKLKKYNEAFPYLQQAKLLAEELKNKYNLYLYYANIGDYFYYEKKYDSALQYCTKALPYAAALNSPHELGFALFSTGSCYLNLGNYSSAGKDLDSALSIANSNQLKDLQRYVYEGLSDLNAKTGNFSAAFKFKNRSVEIRDSGYAEDNIKRIEFLDAKYQGEKKQRELVQLQNDRQIQSLSIRQKTALNYFLVAFLVILLITAFVGYRNFRHRQLLAKQKEALHEQRIRELEKDKQLVAVDSMLKGQEEERTRLAKDLHDGLGSMLSGVKFSLMNMKSNLIINHENVVQFERSLDMLDTSIRELRRVAHNMMPEALIKFGLDEALKDYCNNINNAQIVRVKYQSFGMEQRLESTTEIIIYRIIQELFANIFKHANATEVLVQLLREGNRIGIAVEDNGKGFGTEDIDKNKGAGWANIRSRVEYLKGKLDLHSEAGKGTSVNIEVYV
jgi:two-component system NarL family sensor kinase